jgi:hypothetical protein
MAGLTMGEIEEADAGRSHLVTDLNVWRDEASIIDRSPNRVAATGIELARLTLGADRAVAFQPPRERAP